MKNTTNSGSGDSINEVFINIFKYKANKAITKAKKNINKPNFPNKCIGLSKDLSKNLFTKISNHQ